MSLPISARMTCAVCSLTPGTWPTVRLRAYGCTRRSIRVVSRLGIAVAVSSGRAWPAEKRVSSVKVPVSASINAACLRALPTQGQLSQRVRIALAGDQCVETSLAGIAQHVGDHRGDLDAGVFEQVMQSLRLRLRLPHDLGAVAGQIAHSRRIRMEDSGG